jgi:hypothetical protein
MSSSSLNAESQSNTFKKVAGFLAGFPYGLFVLVVFRWVVAVLTSKKKKLGRSLFSWLTGRICSRRYHGLFEVFIP